jgi:phosphoribosylanthranilate isomerase
MTRVKICGIRRVEDAVLASTLGADAIGFIFWPRSPRYIDPDEARAIVGALPPFVTTVGVFVDQPVAFVLGVAQLLGLGAIQLHGSEDAAAYAGGGPRIIKSVAVVEGGDCVPVVRDVPSNATVLLDAHDPIKRGGTGRAIDWKQAAAAAKVRPVILSGGLHAENIGDAIVAVSPYAIDVSSGVESEPGIKDAGKLRALFAALAQREARTI